MPTGYTAQLMEKGQSFPEFALRCARNFGALIEMRDEPLDAPIPESFPESNYHEEQIAKARQEVVELERMSKQERIAFGQAQCHSLIEGAVKYRDHQDEQDGRLREMERLVLSWNPPSADHIELKKFMLQQIETSYNTGPNETCYWNKKITEYGKKTPLEYWGEALAEAQRAVTYNQEEADKEQARNAGRAQWIRQLRESLIVNKPVNIA